MNLNTNELNVIGELIEFLDDRFIADLAADITLIDCNGEPNGYIRRFGTEYQLCSTS